MMQVCTIVAGNYLAYARVLAASLARIHDGMPLHVLVLDAETTAIGAEPFIVVRPDELGFKPGEFHEMAMIYDVLELSTAVKPWLLRHLLNHGATSALYLDPDIRVLSRIDDADELARRHDIVLTPHTLKPMPRDGKSPSEFDILLAGTYNLGFIAVGPASTAFLDWWAERLRRDCLRDVGRGLFVDQRWIDLAVHYFRHHVIRDPGWNVAYWNLDQRPLDRVDGRLVVCASTLRFFHFSGFDPRQPRSLCVYYAAPPRNVLDELPEALGLCEAYSRDLLAAGFGQSLNTPYGFDTSAGGVAIDKATRRDFRDALLAGDTRVLGVDPFDAADAERFASWLEESRRTRVKAYRRSVRRRLIGRVRRTMAASKRVF